MSIIQEALKKVQKYAQDGQSRTPYQQKYGPEERPLIEKPPAKSAGKISFEKIALKIAIPLVVIALLIVTGIIAGQFLRKAARAGKAAVITPAAPSQDAAYKPIKPSETIAETPPKSAETKAQAPEFILNGIMYLEGGPRAIINDSMVEVGDNVSGAVIVKINRKSVILQFNGTEITLNLK